MKRMKVLPLGAVLAAVVAGCAGTPTSRAPIVEGHEPAPATAQAEPIAAVAPPVVPAAPPATVTPMTVVPPPNGTVLPKPMPLPPPAPSAQQNRELVDRLLPRAIKDRNGWAGDIQTAFDALRIPFTADYLCASMAVIEQESSWQADPPVPGLGKMVWKEIDKRASQYHVPLFAVQAALLKPSPDGRSYKTRIDGLQTEKQMNEVFEELSGEATRIGLPLSMKNPIRTGGPMQVSVEFAQGHARAWPYPYPVKDSIRHEVFSRRGGVYFGIANLLHYRVNYPEMIYRFADFNAGRYSSRNAAFQIALARLAKRKIAPDGDLLRYDDGAPSKAQSETEKLLLALGGKLGLSAADIRRDLANEKSASFEQSLLYQRVFALAEQQAGRKLPRATMPQIRLNSPKITRKLTTEWFAKRVDGRYQQCLLRRPPQPA